MREWRKWRGGSGAAGFWERGTPNGDSGGESGEWPPSCFSDPNILWYELFLPKRGSASMPNVKKSSIALPPEMVAVVRQAVETGEYASSSEVLRDALRDWTQKRSLRQQGIDELRQVWRQAMEDKTPGVR